MNLLGYKYEMKGASGILRSVCCSIEIEKKRK